MLYSSFATKCAWKLLFSDMTLSVEKKYIYHGSNNNTESRSTFGTSFLG